MRAAYLLFLLVGAAAADSLVIQHVTVIDATGRPAQPDMTVVIAGTRIVSVNHTKKMAVIPKDARIIDAQGKFLIPGLWDMHVHGSFQPATHSDRLDLANGVVGVREMNGPPDANDWRAYRARFPEPGPTVFLGSPIVDGPQPVFRESISVANADEGRQAVAEQQSHGADFIKVYSLLPREAYFAISDEARRRGITFAGHVPSSVTAAEASDAGQKSFEHLIGVAQDCSTREQELFLQTSRHPRSEKFDAAIRAQAFATYDENKAQALFARFVKNGTWQCPTLTVLRACAQTNDPKFLQDTRLQYLPLRARSSWERENAMRQQNLASEDWAALQQVFTESMKLVGRMHRAGVRILAGTDAMTAYCFPGFSLHDELGLLVQAGLSPMAALQAATRNPAEFMNRLDHQGTIEPGKEATMLLLDRDPLADIANTRRIDRVFLNGMVLSRGELDNMLAGISAPR